jgi:hypothetical protein
MKELIILLLALVLVAPVLIVLLRSYEYEGDSQMVAITSYILHGTFSIVICLAILILIMMLI